MDISKSKSAIFSNLNSSKMRRKYGLFSVEGEKGIKDTIRSFDLYALIIENGFETTIITDNSISPEKIYYASQVELKKISNLSSYSPIIAIYRLPENESTIPEIKEDSLYLMLDGIQDPGNLGTIIRTCHWFGIYTIFASKETVDIYNPKTIQSTMGSLGKVDVYYCDLKSIISRHPQMPVYGTLLNGADIYSADLTKSGFIVMGNEGNGISVPLREVIDKPLYIPPATQNHPESLNVAIATAVTLAVFSAHK